MPAAPVGRAPFRLTPREQDVLERLTLGRTNREIATELFISEKTASVHVSNIGVDSPLRAGTLIEPQIGVALTSGQGRPR